MHYMTEAALEASANAWHRAFEPKAETTLAAEIEAEAAKVLARITDLDLGDIACSDDLAAMVRAGRLDDAGREFARLIAEHAKSVGEYACGVQ